jgi:hypothetical protein
VTTPTLPELEHIPFRCRIYREKGLTHLPCSGTCDRSHNMSNLCMAACQCECHRPDEVRSLMQGFAYSREFVTSPEALATHPEDCRCAHHYKEGSVR